MFFGSIALASGNNGESIHFCTSFFNLTPTGHKLLPVELFKEPDYWVCFPSCPNKNFCSALTPRMYLVIRKK